MQARIAQNCVRSPELARSGSNEAFERDPAFRTPVDMSSGAEQQNTQPVPEAGRGLSVIFPSVASARDFRV